MLIPAEKVKRNEKGMLEHDECWMPATFIPKRKISLSFWPENNKILILIMNFLCSGRRLQVFVTTSGE
jgi:hypothetical protein